MEGIHKSIKFDKYVSKHLTSPVRARATSTHGSPCLICKVNLSVPIPWELVFFRRLSETVACITDG